MMDNMSDIENKLKKIAKELAEPQSTESRAAIVTAVWDEAFEQGQDKARLEQKEKTCKENGENLTGDDEHVNKTANPLQEQGDGHVHLSHCNQGEYLGGCKYGESDICPALQKEQPQGEALDNPLRYFTENVDAWTEKEWFERLFSAVNDHDKARRDRDDLMADSYINIMNSCAFALARDFPNEIRAALTRGDCAVGDVSKDDVRRVLNAAWALSNPKTFGEAMDEAVDAIMLMLSAAPKVESAWRDIDDWHDDDGLCLFMFFIPKNGVYEYWNTLFTSPASSDWPDTDIFMQDLWGKYQKITTDFDMPQPPKTGGE